MFIYKSDEGELWGPVNDTIGTMLALKYSKHFTLTAAEVIADMGR